jgi:hypothetical protein
MPDGRIAITSAGETLVADLVVVGTGRRRTMHWRLPLV